MEYLVISFIAGMLTVLAPCVLPMLPVILGGSIGSKSIIRPLVVIGALVTSVVAFTLLLKFFTLGINESYLKLASVVVISSFGILLIFPQIWEEISCKLHLGSSSQKLLAQSSQREGLLGYALLGASLGPLFSACSPTYFLIVGTILPQSFVVGLINLLVYAAGMFIVLMAIALLGRKLTSKLQWASDSNGIAKKLMGLVFIGMAAAIYFGYDKVFEAWLLNFDWIQALSSVETSVTDKL